MKFPFSPKVRGFRRCDLVSKAKRCQKPKSSSSLRGSDVPSQKARWGAIEQFALTFSGYDWAGSFEKCSELANSTRKTYESLPERRLPKSTLDELRCCLFFEERISHHAGYDPSAADMVYVRVLVDDIRDGVAARTKHDPVVRQGMSPAKKR
jgi:hypothetical protein